MNGFLTFLLCLAFVLHANGQGPDSLWVQFIGAGGYESPSAILYTQGKELIVVGNTQQGAAQSILLSKLNMHGEVIWTRTYGTSPFMYSASDAILDNDNNIVVIGTRRSSTSNPDICVMKFDTSGNLIWETTYGNSTDIEEGVSITMASDGSYYLLGTYTIPMGGYPNLYILHVSTDGSLLWTKIIDGNIYFFPKKITVTPANQIALLAGFYTQSNYNTKIYIALLDSSGTIIRDFSTGTWGNDVPEDFLPINDSTFWVCGHTNAFSMSTTNKAALFKISTSGKIKDTIILTETIGSQFKAMTSSINGDLLLAGIIMTNTADNNWLIARITSSGQIKWLYTAGGDLPETSKDIIFADTMIISVGSTFSFISDGGEDIGLIALRDASDSLSYVPVGYPGYPEHQNRHCRDVIRQIQKEKLHYNIFVYDLSGRHISLEQASRYVYSPVVITIQNKYNNTTQTCKVSVLPSWTRD